MLMFTQGCVNSAKSLELTIVHTNDIHGRIDYDKDTSVIGYAKMQTYIKNLKKDNKNVLLMDAGDVLHGQPLVTLSKGDNAASLLNIMGYNYFTPGNHDFNYGYSRLKELTEKMKCKTLAANVTLKDGTKPFLENDVVEIDGVKIGLFGLATPETAVKTNPKNVQGINFGDPVKSAKEQVKLLKDKGANVVILLCHLGIDSESEGYRSYNIRDNVDGIDLIIDGHSHSSLDKIKQVEGKAVIASTGAYSENLGIVKVSYKNGKTEVKASNVNSSEFERVEKDKDVENLVNEMKKNQDSALKEVIGKTEIALDGKKTSVRAKETNLTKLFTNFVLKETEAQLVLFNGGTYRESIFAGSITYEDVMKVSPFGNYVVTKLVKGEDILKSLEYGLASYPEVAGKFPQVAGMQCVINSKGSAGSRVKSVKINGEKIDLQKEYTLATTDFVATGGDGYDYIKTSPEVNHFSALDEILIKYIKQIGTITEKTISSLPDGYVIE